jgi:alpha-L-fucosidase
MELQSFLATAASVVPSERQLAWMDTEFYGFVHFTVNTYTDLEWGLGDEPESIFNPTELDCDQWVAALKSAGMRGMVLTAKHHDGFCLWPSKYTEHSIKNSPYRGGKGDIVREASEACRRGGIKFGFYLSPWDRSSPLYGTDAYNDYYKNQLTELLTGYGDIFMVWFDGACGEGPNGRKQVYDSEGYFDLVRKYQPNACIFHDKGPDVRWCGNESGTTRYQEWAVVPSELVPHAFVQTGAAPLAKAGDMRGVHNSDPSIGSLPTILYSKGLAFCPAEVDMSIRPGWFWHENEEPHSLERLLKTYENTVGGNCCFHLNVPPARNGLFDERDVRRLRELGEAIRERYGHDYCKAYRLADDASETQPIYEVALDEMRQPNYLTVCEDIRHGQRIEAFRVEARDSFGRWETVGYGSTVGHKRIVRLHVREKTDALRIVVTAARAKPILRSVMVH